jgi:hypothetical protein
MDISIFNSGRKTLLIDPMANPFIKSCDHYYGIRVIKIIPLTVSVLIIRIHEILRYPGGSSQQKIREFSAMGFGYITDIIHPEGYLEGGIYSNKKITHTLAFINKSIN